MLNSRVGRAIWPGSPDRWRDVPGRLWPGTISVARSTVAAVIAYLLTLAAGQSKAGIDLTGSLTAILVLQATAVSTLRMGLVRVGAVLSGVLIASVLSSYAGLTWWSLGLAIAAALTAARIFRLAPQTPEAAISAMLILGVTHHGIAAQIRVLNTFIGAGVGVAMGLLLPTAVGTASVIQSVRRAAETAAGPLHDAAADLRETAPDRVRAHRWLDRARRAGTDLGEATRGVHELRERRRFNTRALGTTDVVPVLDSAVDTLDRCLLAVRAFFTAIATTFPEEGDNDTLGPDLRQVMSVLLDQIADSITAFGDLAVAEAEAREQQVEEALRISLEYAGESRAMLSDLMLMDPGGTESWLRRGSALSALQQILTELQLEHRQQARQARSRQELPAVVKGALPHPEHPYPRAVDQVLDRRRIVRAQQDRPDPDPSHTRARLLHAGGRLTPRNSAAKLTDIGRRVTGRIRHRLIGRRSGRDD